MSPSNPTASEVAEVLELDLWNEHHYQITATAHFHRVLRRNLEAGNAVGDEPALSSALLHTRSLLEFYRPALRRDHADAVWWVSALGDVPADNHDWSKAIGKHWAKLEPWVQPIHTYLAHISWARRSMSLPKPPDANGQRWPIVEFTSRTLALLDAFVPFVDANGQLGPAVNHAVHAVQERAQDLWTREHQVAAQEGYSL